MQHYSFKEKPPYENSGLSLIFKVKKNQAKMLMKRGFKDAEKEYTKLNSMTIYEFKEYIEDLAKKKETDLISALSNSYRKEDDWVYVYFTRYQDTMRQTGKSIIQDVINTVGIKDSENHIILISNSPLSPDAKTGITSIRKTKFFEFFLYEDLSYDPTEHFLTPKHTLLKYEEAKEILERNRLQYMHLPSISVDDPIARYYGARVGDVMMIERYTLLAEVMVQKYVVFRAVRNIPLK